MGLSEFDPAARERISWNAGGKVGAKRALKPRQIWAVRFFLDQHGRIRDRALFDLAIDSKLRGCDLVKIRISDIVCDRKIRTRATVVQQKTGRSVQFELTDDARASLLKWLEYPSWSRSFWLPITPFTQQRVCQNDDATHDGGDGDLFRLSCIYELLIFVAEIVIKANGDQRRHVDCPPE